MGGGDDYRVLGF